MRCQLFLMWMIGGSGFGRLCTVQLEEQLHLQDVPDNYGGEKIQTV